jgi:hypothetical protein
MILLLLTRCEHLKNVVFGNTINNLQKRIEQVEDMKS